MGGVNTLVVPWRPWTVSAMIAARSPAPTWTQSIRHETWPTVRCVVPPRGPVKDPFHDLVAQLSAWIA